MRGRNLRYIAATLDECCARAAKEPPCATLTMWKTVLAWLAICLLHVCTSSSPEPQYLLMVPTVLHGQHTEKACLLLKHLNEPVTLNLFIEHGGKNESLVSDFVANEDMDPCWDLPVAQVKSNELVYLTLHGKGNNMEFSKKISILLQPSQNLVFVQTDKPIYKPGQKVQFRVVALDENFHPVHEKFPVIYIADSQRNRVDQWRDVETGEGIKQLSFPLDSEPLLGTYKVVVERSHGPQVEHSFIVEEYVLPKYEVLVTVPKTLTILAEEIEVTACAKYTYGKPVPGVINVSVCRKYRQRYSSCYGKESEAVCEEFARAVDSNGCFHETVPTKIFQMKRSGYEDRIQVTARMVEEGTEVEITGEGSSEISSTIGRISFLHLDRYYKKKLPLHGQVRLEDSTGAPLANETVFLTVSEDNLKFNYTTDQEGKASFAIDTSALSALSQYLRVSYKSSEYCGDRNWVSPLYNEDQRTTNYFYSKSESYVTIHPIYHTLDPGHEEHITVHYIVSPEGLGDAEQIIFHYLVMARGGIVKNGRHAVEVPRANQGVPGTFTLSLMISTDIAPLAKMLIVATLPNGEIIADSTNFNIAKAFDNKVNLHFSPTEGLPASQTSLLLEAHPGSLCALRAVDKSVLLMKPEAELSVNSVYDLLPVKDLSGYYHGGMNLKQADPEPCVKPNPIFLNGLFYSPTTLDAQGDVDDILEFMGLKAITNSHIQKPNICAPLIAYSYDVASRSSVMSSRTFDEPEMMSLALPTQETTRKYFPETWLWQLETIDSTGKTELPLTIPDTITEWKANMFCLEKESGFGLSPTVSLTAFQPFFVDLTLPYSVIRGEAFSAKATVFNYLDQGIRMRIKLADSDNYHAEAIGKEEEAYCIPANERVTTSWVVTLQALGEVNFTVSAETLEGEGMCGNMIVTQPAVGRKDTVIKPLLVEPEGIEKEETSNSLLCAKDDHPVLDKISMKVPDNVVEGSARAYFSVIGDIMGIAIQNLHSLLQMPFGCGEQNMVLFAPNIYVLDYLNKTGQLTEEIKSKAIGYLVSGYQRQLKYHHSDGSYSAFGPPSEGNTWLTAFTLKSFAQARRYIYIEERHLTDSMLWLSALQKDNGCFRNKGRLFNNAMKGGVDDDITLSAYVTIALLEYPLPATHPVVRNALFCLETASKGLTNTYTKALMAYAFTLAGKEDLRAELIASLNQESIKKDGTIHWHRISSEHEEHHQEAVPLIWTPPRAPSAEVEMTSYVLLAHLSKHPVSQEDLTNAAKIAAWITKQQNPNGGFTSTQDTVVALHAFAQYGAATYVKNGDSTVTVHSDAKYETQFHVDDGNRLLLQRTQLPTATGMYSVEVKGHGCIYTQSTLRYNIPRPKGDAPFDLHVWTEPDTCDQKSQKFFDVYVNVSYTGKRPSSNMAILDVKMPSGYIPRKSTVKQLQFLDFVGRTEVLPNAAIFYLEHVSNATYSLHFSVEQEFVVTNLKPAMVTVSDYYETDDFAIEDYSAPCSTDPVKGSTS